MSLLELNGIGLDNVEEPSIIPAGEEVKVRVVSVKMGEDKNGNSYIMPIFEALEYPTAKEFSDFLSLPSNNMSEKQQYQAKWKLKNFFEATGFDYSKPFDPEDDLPGLEAWVIVGVRNSVDYGEQNTVKKYVQGAPF